MSHLSLTKTRQGIAFSADPLRFAARRRRPVERVDRPRLSDRVVTSETRLLQASDGPAEVVDLQAIGTDILDLDVLHVAVRPPALDSGDARVPRPGDVE